MDAIVMNTLTGAVSEYDNFAFQSVTPTHAGSATGLFEFGGDKDLTEKIISSVVTGKTLIAKDRKSSVEIVFFSLKGSGNSLLTVFGERASYTYSFQVLAAGVSRAKPGRGIRENYLAFGYSNPDGADFQLDQIEVMTFDSPSRRTQ